MAVPLALSARRTALGLLVAITLHGCAGAPQSAPQPETKAELRQLTVLYTNDEHGYMEGMAPGQGAAGLLQLWKDREGYAPDGPFLILSGGDNWTGPAISTWVEGRSMVEVMNAMGYDAAAVGNHEFDFGLQSLQQRLQQADFPYISANTRWRANRQVPAELGILPFTVAERNGLSIGIIGLTTTSTPRVSNPQNLTGLYFEDYETALRNTAPAVRAQGVDLLFVIAHVCLGELERLAQRTADLGIALMGGGHCNELTARQVGRTVLLGGGYHFTAYARARFRYDTALERLVDVSYGTAGNTGGAQAPVIERIVSRWQSTMGESLAEVIGWNGEAIGPGDMALQRAVVSAWLDAFPAADIAINNHGGLRQPLPAGPVSYRDVVNLLPFENTLILAQISGVTVLRLIEEGSRPIVGGMSLRRGEWILDSGDPLRPDGRYRVLVNSFIYDGGGNYGALQAAGPQGEDTGINYRQPLVDWLRKQESSRADPIRWPRPDGGPARISSP